MAAINDELQEKLQSYHLELAMEKSRVDAEQERTKSFIQDKEELTQRLAEARKLNEEKDRHANRLQKALDLANQHRVQAEESLNQLLTDPLTDLAPPQPNEEIEHLKSQLRISQLQLQSVSEMHLFREEEMQRQIESLQEQLLKAPAAMPPIESTPQEHTQFEDLPGGNDKGDAEEEEKIQEEIMETGLFSKLEENLTMEMETVQDPILWANMEWEKRIIHSANMEFFQYGDAHKYYHTPTLPLPLLKMESEALIQKLKPECADDEMGGYQEIDVKDWQRPEHMKYQPQWMKSWFCKHPATINSYALAPRELRTNPVFCPCI